jgi:hypothetical protein
LLRAFGRLDPRRFGKCSGGVLVFSVDDRGEAAAVASSFPPSTRKEKLQREFPRREHYLLRAFEWLKGWTLADSEAAAVAGTERLRSRASACGETVRRGGGSPSGDRPLGFRRKDGGGDCGGARPTAATATATTAKLAAGAAATAKHNGDRPPLRIFLRFGHGDFWESSTPAVWPV